MRIAILFNPVAGAGRAAGAAPRLEACLKAAGHETQVAETESGPPDDESLRRLAEPVAVLVVVGGDGAVRLAARAAVRTVTPIYNLPYGTENLFAREFSMTRRAGRLLAALRRFQVRRVDVGTANGETFLLMASLGYDAAVVAGLAARRGPAISRWSYARPLLRQLREWRPPSIELIVDGRREASGPGTAIVANCRQYAWRLNPARRADMSDGKLDAVFFPLRSTAGLLGWAAKCGLRRHLADRRLVYRVGQRVEIVSDRPEPFQLDGDPPPPGVQPVTRKLRLEVEAQVLPVLVP